MRFEREVHLDTITVEASGVLELTLVVDRPGEHQPTIQFRDGSREVRSMELERMQLVCKEVCLKADRGLTDFLVIYSLGITGVPVNWDDQW